MKISQVEARRLKRRVEALEALEHERRSAYLRTYPGGVNIGQQSYANAMEYLPAVVNNSRLLGHAVVVVADNHTLRFYAIPHKALPA